MLLLENCRHFISMYRYPPLKLEKTIYSNMKFSFKIVKIVKSIGGGGGGAGPRKFFGHLFARFACQEYQPILSILTCSMCQTLKAGLVNQK
jgi:hypothetical protein